MHESSQRDPMPPSPNDHNPGNPPSTGELSGDGMAGPTSAAVRGHPSDAAETEIWTGRTSWTHYAARLALWLAANIVAATVISWAAVRSDRFTATHAFWAVAAIVALSGVPVVGRVVLRVLGCRYRLTSQRLFITKGIVSQTIDQTELVRVDDVRVHKTFVDRLFGLGTVAIVSTDATDQEITIEGIAASESVAEAIRAQMRAMRRRSLYIENL